MLRVADVLLHVAHVLFILAVLVLWAFPETRVVHLALCGATLVSWFVVGPLVGKPGLCALTAAQHWVWRKRGLLDGQNYMALLYERLTGRKPGSRTTGTIDLITQIVLYAVTAISLLLHLV